MIRTTSNSFLDYPDETWAARGSLCTTPATARRETANTYLQFIASLSLTASFLPERRRTQDYMPIWYVRLHKEDDC